MKKILIILLILSSDILAQTPVKFIKENYNRSTIRISNLLIDMMSNMEEYKIFDAKKDTMALVVWINGEERRIRLNRGRALMGREYVRFNIMLGTLLGGVEEKKYNLTQIDTIIFLKESEAKATIRDVWKYINQYRLTLKFTPEQ